MALLFSCDDESKNEESPQNEQDSTITLDSGILDADVSDSALPVQYYDFNAIEIEPDQDPNLDTE